MRVYSTDHGMDQYAKIYQVSNMPEAADSQGRQVGIAIGAAAKRSGLLCLQRDGCTLSIGFRRTVSVLAAGHLRAVTMA